MITWIYPDSKLPYFDLDSTYLGCSIINEASVGHPQTCIVQFTDNTTEDNQVEEACF